MSPKSIPRVFLDSDVIMDFLAIRHPHFGHAYDILQLIYEGKIQVVVSESALANLIYLSFDIYKIGDAEGKLTELMSFTELVHCTSSTVIQALQSSFKDKEDALQYYTALHNGADYFVTRNTKDYSQTEEQLPVHSPKDFLTLIS